MAKSPRRSIDALFAPSQPRGVEDLTDAKSIAIDLLDANPFQPRRTFDDAALVELAADIEAHGVLQPLLVRPHPKERGRYQIVAGERRWRAARLAGLTEVPCIERDMDDTAMERLALVENVQRADLDPLDEAHAYKRLIEGGLSERDVAASIHKVHSYVQQRLLLIKYPAVVEEVQAGTIGPTVATGIARLADETQRAELLGRARRGERVTVEDLKTATATKEAPTPAADEVANISHSTHEERPVQAAAEAEGKRITRRAPPRAAPVEGVTAALGTLDVEGVAALLAYGEARGWSCAELWQAIKAARPGAVTGDEGG